MVKIFSVILVILLLIFCYASYIEPNRLIIKDISITMEAPIENIAFFTDTHFGNNYSQDKAEEIVNKINEIDAPIVIFGGDLIDDYARDKNLLDLEALSHTLSEIKAKYKIAVWGNHDYGGEASKHYEKIMQDAGFIILKEESLTIEELKINIVGFDDLQLGTSLNKNFEAKEDYFNIYVSHEPDLFTNIDLKDVDLCLSGHSHGGQISLPFVGSLIKNKGARKYIKGVYNIGATKLFVSSGIGTTILRMRLLNVPEIVNIKYEGE